jgi:tRNA modification GTPase
VASPAEASPRPVNDTIAAVATPPGRGGIGVIRISGPALDTVCLALAGKLPPARTALLSTFRDASGEAIDQGLLLYFPAPYSFTGEDVLELQGHGGPVVMQRLLARCLELGARLAQPGEFSLRAFNNGRMDLAQAEAIADLIDAETTAAARAAMRSLRGDFSRVVEALADEVVELRALTEATLDFPEEEVDFLKAADAFVRLRGVEERLTDVFSQSRRGALLRRGLNVVLAGQPNVGKSSLLNRLAGEELAIVTPVAGTTRDALRGVIQLHGVPVHIIDTAGLRDTDDALEQIGIERSWREINNADALLVIADARAGVTAIDQAIVARLPSHLPVVTVLNKADLVAKRDEAPNSADAIYLSAKTGAGIDALERRLLDLVGWQDNEDVFVARERHLEALELAAGHVAGAAAHADQLELFAEELRLAHRALQSITGEFTPDDLLGTVFSRFCIGK